MNQLDEIAQLAFDYRSDNIGRSLIVHADCFEWLGRVPENSIHAIVTDPPYGVKEYDLDQLKNERLGKAVSGASRHRLTVTPAPRCQDSRRLTLASGNGCGSFLSIGRGWPPVHCGRALTSLLRQTL